MMVINNSKFATSIQNFIKIQWLVTEKSHQTDLISDGRTDGLTDGLTDGRTELDIEVHSHFKNRKTTSEERT